MLHESAAIVVAAVSTAAAAAAAALTSRVVVSRSILPSPSSALVASAAHGTEGTIGGFTVFVDQCKNHPNS